MLNNNGIATSRRRDKTVKNVKLPSIENKKQLAEQVSTNYILYQ